MNQPYVVLSLLPHDARMRPLRLMFKIEVELDDRGNINEAQLTHLVPDVEYFYGIQADYFETVAQAEVKMMEVAKRTLREKHKKARNKCRGVQR